MTERDTGNNNAKIVKTEKYDMDQKLQTQQNENRHSKDIFDKLPFLKNWAPYLLDKICKVGSPEQPNERAVYAILENTSQHA